APSGVEAALMERRLTRWGASAMHLAPHMVEMFAQRHWDAVLVDHAAAQADGAKLAALDAGRRIVLITPAERPRLAALKAAGFDGYLVKPVRAASLKAQLLGAPGFEAAAGPNLHVAADTAAQPHHPLNVLVAEDNEINALLTRSLLAALGHR